MGKKGSWLYALGCVRPKSNEKKHRKKTRKSKGSFCKPRNQELDSSDESEIEAVNPTLHSPNPKEELISPVIEDVRDGQSLIEGENEDAMDAHSSVNDIEDGDGYSMLEAEDEDATKVHSVGNDTDDGDGHSVVEVENEDARNDYSDSNDIEDEDGNSVVKEQIEDAWSFHFHVNDTEDGDGYSVVEEENEDVTNVNSAGNDIEDGDGNSVVEDENEDAWSAHFAANDTEDGDENSVVEDENEDVRYVNSVGNDTEDGDGNSVVQDENEDAGSAHVDANDTDNGDEYSVVDAENEDATNVHSTDKDTDDVYRYSVVKAENEDAMSAHSADKDIEDVDGYSMVEVENEDARKAHSEENVPQDDQAMHACSITSASVAGEAEVGAVEAAAEDVQLATAAHPPVKSKEEIAAFKIQSLFRGYVARRSFRAVKGLMRLKTLVRRQPVKRQATTTLHCMQTMARVQNQVGARRIRMSEENQALQRQLKEKHYLDKLIARKGEDWDDSPQSKEQVEEQRRKQQLAVIRRERELAYAYSQQQTGKNSPKQARQTSLDPYNPQWGWNWLEKWMATRPWENNSITELNSEPPSAKSVTTLAQKVRRDLKLDQVKSSSSPKQQTRTPGRLSVSSPRTTTPKSASAGRVRVPKSSVHNVDDDDVRSMQSARSEPHRRHSGTCPSARDIASQESLATAPSFMSPTISAKAKSRLSMEKNGTPDKVWLGSAKKLVSLSESPSAERRHSEPSKTPEGH
ncbi:hypothetical protein LIER_12109 [Lithospermum erythrorhizon]|uniref:Uncharacterized protein n=1 Tax=Lithospermum erythrorhizon TaxID=34254 RepID=A0AAV3PRZ5_LITER